MKNSPTYIYCGRIGRAIALAGACAVYWNNEQAPVEVGDELFIREEGDDAFRSLRVVEIGTRGRFDAVRFEHVDDREAAQKLSQHDLFLPEDRLTPLKEGEYYCYQLLGMTVVTDEGRELGTVVRIFSAGGHDVYEVLPEGETRGHEILLPAIRDVILSIDVKARRMVVRPMEGML
jgi:16S rRNA processing protein RimM